MAVAEDSPVCSACHSSSLRPRRRDALLRLAVSWAGRWPYKCDTCGAAFFLRKRWVRAQLKSVKALD